MLFAAISKTQKENYVKRPVRTLRIVVLVLDIDVLLFGIFVGVLETVVFHLIVRHGGVFHKTPRVLKRRSCERALPSRAAAEREPRGNENVCFHSGLPRLTSNLEPLLAGIR